VTVTQAASYQPSYFVKFCHCLASFQSMATTKKAQKEARRRQLEKCGSVSYCILDFS